MAIDTKAARNQFQALYVVTPAFGMALPLGKRQAEMGDLDARTRILGSQIDFKPAETGWETRRTASPPANDEPVRCINFEISPLDIPAFEAKQELATRPWIEERFVAHPRNDCVRLGEVSKNVVLPCMDQDGLAIGLNCHVWLPPLPSAFAGHWATIR